MKKLISVLTLCLLAILTTRASDVADIFIIIGQSNADGSAFVDEQIDEQMRRWWTSDANTHRMKIWYRSTEVENQPANARGEEPRWVIDGRIEDAEPGWMELWYRNENTLGRTAMNMIHGYGTYSTGSGANCAQGRRGLEGALGQSWATAVPDRDLYVLKLGVSGSQIATWADPDDSHNWQYFLDNIYRPAVADLESKGLKPRIAGIWWMQGCGDAANSRDYYEARLRRLIEQCRSDLDAPDAPFWIGHVVKPGENPDFPGASTQFGQGVRDAQDAVAADTDGVEIIDTSALSFQDEPQLGGYLHFDHAAQCTLGRMLAAKLLENLR